MKKGIYIIKNNINNNIYIGSSKNIKNRFKEHKRLLKNNIHHNNKLQNSYNKYGLKYFIFSILEECDIENLLKREQHYIDTLKPYFNICKIAGKSNGMNGKKHSLKTKNIMREKRLLFIKNNPNHIEQMKKNNSGTNNGMYGKHQTEKFKEERRNQMKKRWENKEFRENQIIKRKGRKTSESFIIKMSGKNNPMYGKKGILSPNFGKKMSENTMIKIRKSVIKPIIQINKYTNEIIREFNSITDASNFYKINGIGNISNCANGKLKTAYGYIWKYKN